MISRSTVAAAGIAAVVTAAAPIVSQFEGMRRIPYYDVGHVLTVCFGETAGITQRVYSIDECNQRLSASLVSHYVAMSKCVDTTKLMLSQRVAFLSLTYNVGAGAFCASSIPKKLAAGNYSAACATISQFNQVRIGGQLVAWPGLTARRSREREICEGRLP